MLLLLQEPGTVWPMSQTEARDLIHAVPLFEGLKERDLDELAADCRARMLMPGEVLVNYGDPSNAVFIVADGELDVLRHAGTDLILIGVRGAGEVVGEMALLTRGPRNATLRARTEAHVLEIGQDKFATWLESHPGAAMRVLETIVSRLQSAEGHLVQHQHLTALGTLAAGMAHELNNPASALLRTAGQLGKEVEAWSALSWDLGQQMAPQSGRQTLESSLSAIEDVSESISTLSPLERNDRESAVQAWLARHQIADAWRLAAVLVESGWDIDALQDMAVKMPHEQLESSLRWLATGATVHRLLGELRMSAQVISTLVGAVKSYSRLDEAPVQNVDIHAGIEQSLVILRYKLRDIDLVREYAPELPPIVANPGELNQLWTNLIDNAAAAAGAGGQVVIRTRAERRSVVIEVEDNGPGVLPEISDRIFEPFFTTRPPGEGTGLGLAISYSIVQKHRGSIVLDSVPGRTIFKVSLPIMDRPE